MKRSFILWNGLLEQWAADDTVDNIILGTGVLARDMKKTSPI